MFKLIAIVLFALRYIAKHSDATPVMQVLPQKAGYVPVYIRVGNTPLDEINYELAEAFHEMKGPTAIQGDLVENNFEGIGKWSETHISKRSTEDNSKSSSEEHSTTVPNKEGNDNPHVAKRSADTSDENARNHQQSQENGDHEGHKNCKHHDEKRSAEESAERTQPDEQHSEPRHEHHGANCPEHQHRKRSTNNTNSSKYQQKE